MAHTVANATGGGRAYNIVGSRKETVTDVTWSGATASETVTASELGLNAVEQAHAFVLTPQASATGVQAAVTVGSALNQITVAMNTAAGAGTGQANVVARVFAKGW